MHDKNRRGSGWVRATAEGSGVDIHPYILDTKAAHCGACYTLKRCSHETRGRRSYTTCSATLWPNSRFRCDVVGSADGCLRYLTPGLAVRAESQSWMCRRGTDEDRGVCERRWGSCKQSGASSGGQASLSKQYSYVGGCASRVRNGRKAGPSPALASGRLGCRVLPAQSILFSCTASVGIPSPAPLHCSRPVPGSHCSGTVSHAVALKNEWSFLPSLPAPEGGLPRISSCAPAR